MTIVIIRFLRSLKEKIKNKGRVEGSICAAYLIEETSTFGSIYFPPDVDTRRTRMPRNVGSEGSSFDPPISVFNYPGCASGHCYKYHLDEREMKAVHLYVLQNCEEVEPYLEYVVFNLNIYHS